MMKDPHEIIGRRDFFKQGARAIVLSGLAFVGITLGRRSITRSGKKTSCVIDLPCRICSKLPGCEERIALDTKREYRDSLGRL